MKVEFINADNDWQKGSTTYWFNVELSIGIFAPKFIAGVVESGCDDPLVVFRNGDLIVEDEQLSKLPSFVTDEIRGCALL